MRRAAALVVVAVSVLVAGCVHGGTYWDTLTFEDANDGVVIATASNDSLSSLQARRYGKRRVCSRWPPDCEGPRPAFNACQRVNRSALWCHWDTTYNRYGSHGAEGCSQAVHLLTALVDRDGKRVKTDVFHKTHCNSVPTRAVQVEEVCATDPNRVGEDTWRLLYNECSQEAD